MALSFGANSGCSGSPGEAVSESAGTGATETDPARLDADFMRAYRKGFSSSDAGSGNTHRDETTTDDVAETDRDFIAGHSQLTRLPVQDVARFVSSGDADALLLSRYEASGLTRGELVSANVLLFVSAWEAYNGLRAAPEQVRGLQTQMRELWTRGPDFDQSAEGQRQRRLYELLAAILIRESSHVRQSGDPDRIAAFKETVREDFLRQSNNDLARYDLTVDGFVER